VNRLVDPRTEHDIQQDSIGNARMLQKGEKQFHEAEDRVIFEGVIVVGNDIWMNTYRLGKVGFKKEWLFNDDTINQALNNGVTLYMKIK
jgi:hypothetical protein